ncbi:hypothetical protein OTK49_28380 [Vibrio coralliirubri]|uniref:hypothetical protein n=1 Tax=Vibrio coralliirubri TaxID=1516159 RepID=UPI002283A03D|nr:hypothetical protein [Vibrio coralliirubri]MCY9866461.1 hypothetical protein [Vibrio coralliirubri]
MTYSLTPEQVNSITDIEAAFSTIKLLPEWDQIPDEFKRDQRIECKVVASMFYGCEMPDSTVEFNAGFEPEKVMRCFMAHLSSFSPKHERKMAGVAYMMSIVCNIKEE